MLAPPLDVIPIKGVRKREPHEMCSNIMRFIWSAKRMSSNFRRSLFLFVLDILDTLALIAERERSESLVSSVRAIIFRLRN